MPNAKFINNCVNWPANDVETGLIPLIENREQIDRDEFVNKISIPDLILLEKQLGYDDSFEMRNDWHVEYFISKLHNKTVYGFRHSAIEYVFL